MLPFCFSGLEAIFEVWGLAESLYLERWQVLRSGRDVFDIEKGVGCKRLAARAGL